MAASAPPPAAGSAAAPPVPSATAPPTALAARGAAAAAPPVAAAPPPAAAPAAAERPPGVAPDTVYVPQLATLAVSRGDNLWSISRRSYGQGARYTVIYDANQGQIQDPALIYPGQVFVMPREGAGPQARTR